LSYFPEPNRPLEGAVELKICERHGGLFFRKDKDQRYCRECLRKWPGLREPKPQPASEEYWTSAFRRVM
jgi:hypothetical protein